MYVNLHADVNNNLYPECAQKCVVVFSHDVATAMLVLHTSHVGTEILFYANSFFCFPNPIYMVAQEGRGTLISLPRTPQHHLTNCLQAMCLLFL